MSGAVALKQEHLDMDSLFDFTQSSQSPIAASSTMDASISPSDKMEERQQFNGPSHDYNQYKQQVGLPVGSMVNMTTSQPAFEAYNSGITDFDAGFGAWSSGIDIDADIPMDFSNPQSAMPAMFFPAPRIDSPNDNFINPNSIGVIEEPTSNVGRLWPGMHSQQAQQAAMQKAAQAHAHQQRQTKRPVQHIHHRQPSQTPQASAPASAAASKRASHVSEPHVEESISRLLNQMRQQSNVSSDDAESPSGLLPHIARMKKDEEEMDEDERLLASEEGKKLSSKERRQLRNKVSARAFRSRRKEYITQLEGEVALKAQECNNLRQQNIGLIQENDRYRALIETLLRHPAFHPFINDLSKDPTALLPGQQQAPIQMQAPPQLQQQQQPQQTQQPSQPSPANQQQQQSAPQQSSQQDIKPEFLDFDASQLQIPQSQPEQQQHVGLAMIPEENFSKLNINGFNRPYAFNNFSSVNAYAVTDIPAGPDPVELLAAPSASCLDSTDSNRDLDLLLEKLDFIARRTSINHPHQVMHLLG